MVRIRRHMRAEAQHDKAGGEGRAEATGTGTMLWKEKTASKWEKRKPKLIEQSK